MIQRVISHEETSGVGLNKLTDVFLAELLHAKGAHVEPNTLENLVTHQSKNNWLLCD